MAAGELEVRPKNRRVGRSAALGTNPSYAGGLLAGVAFLESRFNLDLQHAMLLVPVAYALSGLAFYGAEAVMKYDPGLRKEA